MDELEPEIVNFKTGGFLKSIATDGLVKGNINGHIQGKSSKNVLTFPVILAVYVPEGVNIAEYQLLRLRLSGNAREFRSVTGGVIHSSGGATRDNVQFQSQKIAPRVYQITLDQSLGKGEYGLLPPGSYTSSNMASGGKIYSVSVAKSACRTRSGRAAGVSRSGGIRLVPDSFACAFGNAPAARAVLPSSSPRLPL